MLKRILIPLVLLVVVPAAIFLMMQSGFKPMSSDLSVVGKGKPSLVLAYENYALEGGSAINQLNAVRGDYEDKMHFAVADLGTPQGKAFADRFDLFDGVAVFLSGDGKPVRIARIPKDEQALRDQLDSKLAQVGLSR